MQPKHTNEIKLFFDQSSLEKSVVMFLRMMNGRIKGKEDHRCTTVKQNPYRPGPRARLLTTVNLVLLVLPLYVHSMQGHWLLGVHVTSMLPW